MMIEVMLMMLAVSVVVVVSIVGINQDVVKMRKNEEEKEKVVCYWDTLWFEIGWGMRR